MAASAAWRRSHFLGSSTGYASLGEGNLPRQAKLHPLCCICRFVCFSSLVVVVQCLQLNVCVCVFVCVQLSAIGCVKKELVIECEVQPLYSSEVQVMRKRWGTEARKLETENGGRQFIKKENRVVLMLQTPAVLLLLVAGGVAFTVCFCYPFFCSLFLTKVFVLSIILCLLFPFQQANVK